MAICHQVRTETVRVDLILCSRAALIVVPLVAGSSLRMEICDMTTFLVSR
jgi:hypothetical protein